MGNLNYVFFEEFKHLDKLCGELYGDQHGVSHYINDMKDIPRNDYRYIPNWKGDLAQLTRLRHIRNHLAHTAGAFNEELCTQNDTEWIRNFYERILNQSDPLAMLSQYSKTKQQIAKTQTAVSQIETPSLSIPDNVDNERLPDDEMNSFCSIVLVLVIVGILLSVIFGIVGLFE